jgi:hypothetical protein
MRKFFYSLKGKLVIVISLLLLTNFTQAQLKIGDNPTSIQKSSILELESTRQGLLLPRLTDTAAINALTPPDGMIIYLTSDKSLRIRSNGAWLKLADMGSAANNWSLNGNSGTTAPNFLGTIDSKPLIIKTNNNEAMRIDSSGNIGIGTNNPTAKLNVDGTVKFENLAANTTDVEVLVIMADGSVQKRTMSTSAFVNAISAINGLQHQALTISAQATDTSNNVLVQNRNSDSTIAIYLPVQDGSAGSSKPYGFLKYNDWQKIQTAVQVMTIGAVASSSDVNGATVTKSNDTLTLVLHPADAANPGIVTAGSQTFGGDKTFAGNTTINGTATLNSVATNTTADSVLVLNNGVVEKRKVGSSVFNSAIQNINGNRDTVQTLSFRNSGTDLTVSANGADSVFLNVPDAGIGARGVVTAGAQTFGGNKTFQDSVNATKTMLVGTTGNANSTVQVSGSLSMTVTTITSNYTLTSADNTVLANTTSGALTVTLPAPGAITGRIYTIKKIGTGGIDNQLTITPTSGTIDGGASYTIYNDWTYVTMQTDGTNWYIIKK